MTNYSRDQEREKLRRVLKTLRKNRGLTQAQLSEALAKPQSYVCKYETGERRLDYIEIQEICQNLGISMREFDQLFTDAG